MAYPPPNPYDPAQGYGQPTPQHYTTDADPYSRPDPYGPGTGYGNPPLNVQPGSVPPGQPYSPAAYPAQTGAFQPPAGPPGGAFQPGQAAPPPPRGNSNAPLIITFVVIILAIATGGIFLAVNLGDDDGDPVAESTTTEAPEETTEPAEETTEPEPSTEEATTGEESVYRVPQEGECIENVTTGFYVVDCEAADAYWYVVHIAKNPEDPDPTDQWHSVAANDACDGYEWTQYYYTDTAIAAGRDWDPEIDSITAIYCVREV
ncbi:hypothetical protein [Glycomyces paridis]|uniref:Septum formation-related domain-containing protein n=1 Tax=Glycomyces paridis TaxID=2126555 RepID=A0A4S8NYL0_9ACTN|nr:hypothetical protein [Glycomyces paridis]THV22833.1 hypothetical protein E9998_23355 [Glycomyces paridis]